MIFILFL